MELSHHHQPHNTITDLLTSSQVQVRLMLVLLPMKKGKEGGLSSARFSIHCLGLVDPESPNLLYPPFSADSPSTSSLSLSPPLPLLSPPPPPPKKNSFSSFTFHRFVLILSFC